MLATGLGSPRTIIRVWFLGPKSFNNGYLDPLGHTKPTKPLAMRDRPSEPCGPAKLSFWSKGPFSFGSPVRAPNLDLTTYQFHTMYKTGAHRRDPTRIQQGPVARARRQSLSLGRQSKLCGLCYVSEICNPCISAVCKDPKLGARTRDRVIYFGTELLGSRAPSTRVSRALQWTRGQYNACRGEFSDLLAGLLLHKLPGSKRSVHYCMRPCYGPLPSQTGSQV